MMGRIWVYEEIKGKTIEKRIVSEGGGPEVKPGRDTQLHLCP